MDKLMLLQKELIERELLKGNDFAKDILKIKHPGIIKATIKKDLEFIESSSTNEWINKQFNIEDILCVSEIKKGLDKDLDIFKYAKHSFNYRQMRVIRQGLELGFNVSIYAKSHFDWRQMTEILDGLEFVGPSAWIYVKPTLDWEQMQQIKEGLILGEDISIYAKEEFNSQQMNVIRRGIDSKIDTSIYAKVVFSAEQMLQICIGLESNLDVSSYAKKEFGSQEMSEKRIKLIKDKIQLGLAYPEKMSSREAL